MSLKLHLKALALGAVLCSGMAHAVTTSFFNGSQPYTLDTSGETFNTLTSAGYRFTWSQDKLFTGGYGMTEPIGRSNVISWPAGLHAQAVTIAPYQKAHVTVERVDGNAFDIDAFSVGIYSYTAAGGAELEVVAKLNGEDLLNDPVFFPASGYWATPYTYSKSGTVYPGGYTSGLYNTSLLTGADSYTIALFSDFALTGITLTDASIAAPAPAPAPVPEPETYAMLLAGLGLMGLVLRRNRRRHG